MKVQPSRATSGTTGRRVVRVRSVDVRFKAWRSLLEAHAVVVQRVEQLLQERAELPFTWYDVLFQLDEAPDQRLRMNELADAVLLTRSGLTRSIDRIEAAGLVARQAIPGDRRSTHIVLTEAGRERLAAAFPVVTAAVQEWFGSQLTDEEAASLARILGRVRDRARGHPAQGRPSRR